MAYVVAAKWTARPDEVDEVARCLGAPGPASRAEPGNLQYTCMATRPIRASS